MKAHYLVKVSPRPAIALAGYSQHEVYSCHRASVEVDAILVDNAFPGEREMLEKALNTGFEDAFHFYSMIVNQVCPQLIQDVAQLGKKIPLPSSLLAPIPLKFSTLSELMEADERKSSITP